MSFISYIQIGPHVPPYRRGRLPKGRNYPGPVDRSHVHRRYRDNGKRSSENRQTPSVKGGGRTMVREGLSPWQSEDGDET